LKPFEAREATELAQRTAERAAFMERLGELNEILMAREEALVRKLDQMAHMNAKLEAMPVEVPLVTV
jgi:uncharacterized coiled-coil protein SlyX